MTEPTETRTIIQHPAPTLTHRGLLGAGVAIAVALLLLVGALIYVYLQLESVSRDNSQAIARLNRIQHPTKKQFAEDLAQGIKRCLKVPECARLFPGLKHATHNHKTILRQEQSAAREARKLAGIRRRVPVSMPPLRKTPPVPVAHSPPVHHKSPPSKPSQGGPPPASPTPPSPPPPTVTVQTHLPAPLPNPTVCTDRIKINC